VNIPVKFEVRSFAHGSFSIELWGLAMGLALHCQVGLASGDSLGRDWRRRPGRPRALWTDQLRNDTGSVPVNLWRQTGHPTESWWIERRDGPSWLRDDDDDESSRLDIRSQMHA